MCELSEGYSARESRLWELVASAAARGDLLRARSGVRNRLGIDLGSNRLSGVKAQRSVGRKGL